MLFKEAKKKFLEAEPLNPEHATYLMAYLYLVMGNEIECRKLLIKSLEIGRDRLLDYLVEDPHFDSVKEKEWFKKLISS